MAAQDIAVPSWTAVAFDDAKAVRLIGFALCLTNLVFILAMIQQGAWPIASDGPVATDFVNVWAAGLRVLAGNAAAAYDPALHKELEVAAVGHGFAGLYAWCYPPYFLVVAAPLALLPYTAAALVWPLVTFPAYALSMRRIAGHRVALWLACGFPPVLANFVVGQNGFLTAALLGGALANLERRPALAGLLLGLMSYKPQFGILFPLVLIAAGSWRAFGSAAAVVTLLAALSTAAFGVGIWADFARSLGQVNQGILGAGEGNFDKLQSLFGLARVLGAGESSAWWLHGVLTALTAALLWRLWRGRLWRGRLPFDLKAAAVATGALLATPYLYNYDLVILAVPMAFLIRLGRERGFLPHELAAMAGTTLLLLSFPFVQAPVGFLAIVVVAALVVRRMLHAAGSDAVASAPAPDRLHSRAASASRPEAAGSPAS